MNHGNSEENELTNTLFVSKGWRGYKNYIGTKILYPGFSAKLRQIVLDSKKGGFMIVCW